MCVAGLYAEKLMEDDPFKAGVTSREKEEIVRKYLQSLEDRGRRVHDFQVFESDGMTAIWIKHI